MGKSNKPVLVSSFKLCNHRRLFFTQMKLYHNRLTFEGWALGGRYARTISLDDIERVEWWSARDDVNLALYLSRGKVIELVVPAAGNWKFAIDAELPSRREEKNRLPDDTSQDRVVQSRTAAA